MGMSRFRRSVRLCWARIRVCWEPSLWRRRPEPWRFSSPLSSLKFPLTETDKTHTRSRLPCAHNSRRTMITPPRFSMAVGMLSFFGLVHALPAQSVNLFGVELVNARYVSAFVPTTIAAGNFDVYTVPAGRRAYIAYLTCA